MLNPPQQARRDPVGAHRVGVAGGEGHRPAVDGQRRGVGRRASRPPERPGLSPARPPWSASDPAERVRGGPGGGGAVERATARAAAARLSRASRLRDREGGGACAALLRIEPDERVNSLQRPGRSSPGGGPWRQRCRAQGKGEPRCRSKPQSDGRHRGRNCTRLALSGRRQDGCATPEATTDGLRYLPRSGGAKHSRSVGASTPGS